MPGFDSRCGKLFLHPTRPTRPARAPSRFASAAAVSGGACTRLSSLVVGPRPSLQTGAASRPATALFPRRGRSGGGARTASPEPPWWCPGTQTPTSSRHVTTARAGVRAGGQPMARPRDGPRRAWRGRSITRVLLGRGAGGAVLGEASVWLCGVIVCVLRDVVVGLGFRCSEIGQFFSFSHMVQWLGYHVLTVDARVRFPVWEVLFADLLRLDDWQLWA